MSKVFGQQPVGHTRSQVYSLLAYHLARKVANMRVSSKLPDEVQFIVPPLVARCHRCGGIRLERMKQYRRAATTLDRVSLQQSQFLQPTEQDTADIDAVHTQLPPHEAWPDNPWLLQG